MATDQGFSHTIRLTEKAARKPIRFDLAPDAAALETIAADLGIPSVRKLTFRGELRPDGRRDWMLEADLGATVVQDCIVTLAPVTTRIDEKVTRRYLAEMPEPGGDEAEMPEDDTLEPLSDTVDAGAVMVEALALALPLYPRADGVAFGGAEFAPPGAEPLGETARRPFAGLADMLKRGGKDD